VKFASLGSGSRGNATIVEVAETTVLIDCGFSLKETERRLAMLGHDAALIDAILVTHEHSDHVRGVGPVARRHKIPVYCSRGTATNANWGNIEEVNLIDVHHGLTIKDMQVQPFPVPHDAREPCQFVISDGDKQLGILTDTGSLTSHIEEQLSGCDALILECNHDEALLASGPYPPSLKDRVGGRFGHLSNRQSARLLEQLDTSRLSQIVAAHLSEENNSPDLAQWALSDVLGCEADWVQVARQDTVLDWCIV
jgi:phosphoribosyl 1,2-cyclic phosphodiesterase